jgi:hypothetical protein
MHTEQTIDEALRERAIALLSAMLLYMKDSNKDTMTYKQTIPVALRGNLAKKAGKTVEEWEIQVTVRKKEAQ